MGYRLKFDSPEVSGSIDRETKHHRQREIVGWLGSTNEQIVRAALHLTSGETSPLTLGIDRPDVEKRHGNALLNAGKSGFVATLKGNDFPIQFFGSPANSASISVHLASGKICRSNTFPIRTESFENCITHNLPLADEIGHSRWKSFLVEKFDKPGLKVLEVGSRNVVGGATKALFKSAVHVGFDIYHGENVDIVGDAHRLSHYFEKWDRFDLVFSSAVFEHLAMPWIASVEMVKVLRVGGHVFAETHYSYSSHERPWHFFQFSDTALQILFNQKMGIECISSGVSNPIIGYFSPKSDEYLRGRQVRNMYCHSEFLGQKTDDSVDSFSWQDVGMQDVVGRTSYPRKKII